MRHGVLKRPTTRPMAFGAGCSARARSVALVGLAVGAAACNGQSSSITGPPCGVDADCAAGQTCGSGACETECHSDADCPVGERCWVDFGCLDEDFDEPRNGPARDIPFDPSAPLSVAFKGCSLDFDCAFGFECKEGSCVKVDPSAPCVWSDDTEMKMEALVVGPMPALMTARHEGTYAASLDDRVVEGNEGPTLWVFHYTDRIMRGAGCDLQGNSGTFGGFVVMPDATQWAALGQADDNMRIECDAFARLASASAVVPNPGPGWRPVFMERSEGSYYVVAEDTDGLWVNSEYFADVGIRPSLAVNGPTMVFTAVSLDGIQDLDGQREVVAAGHSGVGVHYRGRNEYGWFSFDGERMLYYSVGSIGGPWETQSVGVKLSVMRGYEHISTHPVTGEPHLALIVAPERPADPARIVSIVGGIDGWRAWETPIGATDARHAKASWSGCGRPAVEFAAIGGTGPLGWYVLEAR